MKVEIYRHKFTVDKRQTLGTLCVLNDYETILYSCKTLELPWYENERRKSCIPTGTYRVDKYNSKRFGLCFRLREVPEREGILIHAGNTFKQTSGCILVGEGFKDIDSDKLTDITNSKKTLNELLDLLPLSFELTIY